MLVKGARRLVETGGRQVDMSRRPRTPATTFFAHLEFARRKEGLHLELLRKVLVKIAPEDVAEYVRSRPTGLRYLIIYDEIRSKMRDVIELPDRIEGLFLNLARQNGGTISKKKRALPEFATLTDAEVAAMEAMVRDGLAKPTPD